MELGTLPYFNFSLANGIEISLQLVISVLCLDSGLDNFRRLKGLLVAFRFRGWKSLCVEELR